MKYKIWLMCLGSSILLGATGGPLDFPVTMSSLDIKTKKSLTEGFKQGLLFGTGYCAADQSLHVRDDLAFHGKKYVVQLVVSSAPFLGTFEMYRRSNCDIARTVGFGVGCVPGVMVSFALKRLVPEGMLVQE